MIKEELKKVLFRFKLFYLIIIGIVITIIVYKYNVQRMIKNDNPIVNEIIMEYSGRINDEKLIEINSKFNEYNSDGNSMEAMSEFYSGKISAVEYYNIIESFNENAKSRYAFYQLKEMAEYAEESPDNHYILNKTGWTHIFLNDHNIVLPVLYLAAAIILFTFDSGQPVQLLFYTTTNGRRKNVASKTIAYIIICAILTIVFHTVAYLCVGSDYKLYGWSYPVQSILQFENYPGRLSIILAYIIIGVMKFVGSILTGLITYLITIISKNKYLGIMTAFFLSYEWMFLPSAVIEKQYLFPMNCYNSLTFVSSGEYKKVAAVGAVLIIVCFFIIYFHERENRRGMSLHEK